MHRDYPSESHGDKSGASALKLLSLKRVIQESKYIMFMIKYAITVVIERT